MKETFIWKHKSISLLLVKKKKKTHRKWYHNGRSTCRLKRPHGRIGSLKEERSQSCPFIKALS
jgi:hypothetical protein